MSNTIGIMFVGGPKHGETMIVYAGAERIFFEKPVTTAGWAAHHRQLPPPARIETVEIVYCDSRKRSPMGLYIFELER